MDSQHSLLLKNKESLDALPFLKWRKTHIKAHFKNDLKAGLVGIFLILPQSIALALLAGMPPIYGLYTSIFAIILANLWGASPFTLSGPNTAICVLLAMSITPLAPQGSEQYIAYVLAITFSVGILQLLVGFLKLGAILDFISQTVIHAIIQAVALIIIVSSIQSLFGLDRDASIWRIFTPFPNGLTPSEAAVVIIGICTVCAGLISNYFSKRYALFIAVMVGWGSSYILHLFPAFSHTTPVLLGDISITESLFHAPSISLLLSDHSQNLSLTVLAIAFLGLMQTVAISRSLSERVEAKINTNQEIVGQGISNLLAPFLSAFVSAGSFSRSTNHQMLGAKTPMAGIYLSLTLILMLLISTPILSQIPLAIISGLLIIIGWNLISKKEIYESLKSKQEATIFLSTFIVSIAWGLNIGVITGVVTSLIFYLWYTAKPHISIQQHVARDGRKVFTVKLYGSLFFGAVNHIANVFDNVPKSDENTVLVYRTDNTSYMDIHGANILAKEALKRKKHGDDFYLFSDDENLLDILSRYGVLRDIGSDHLIFSHRDHPMKPILWPYEKYGNDTNEAIELEENAWRADVLIKFSQTIPYSTLHNSQHQLLLDTSPRLESSQGDVILNEVLSSTNYLILLDGEVKISAQINETETRIIQVHADSTQHQIHLIPSAHKLKVVGLTDSSYLLIEQENVKRLLKWNVQLKSAYKKTKPILEKMARIKGTWLFYRIPVRNLTEVFSRMTRLNLQAGDTVFRQGDEGNDFYFIESGEVEVWRTDPFSNKTIHLATLGEGKTFGEESLLQNGSRNASVTMSKPGQLHVLHKADFVHLIKQNMIESLKAEIAQKQVKARQSIWLDCRYDMEYAKGHIFGALSLPMDKLRENYQDLNVKRHYILYCQDGQRSATAAFLLKQRGVNVNYLEGGLKNWKQPLVPSKNYK